jgi:Transposase
MLLRPREGGAVDPETADLIALRDWLHAHGVTHVALESTGVYWKPIYYVLEDTFQLWLINMHELKRVPGRKTDVQDSEWLAQRLECGFLKASFVPPPAIRELRDLTRYQVQQVRDRSREVNRLCKVLEDAGIKQTSVATDVLGVSGRAMVDALVAGTTDPIVLAELARGKLRTKVPTLRRALQGRFRRHMRFWWNRSSRRSIFSMRRSRGSPPKPLRTVEVRSTCWGFVHEAVQGEAFNLKLVSLVDHRRSSEALAQILREPPQGQVAHHASAHVGAPSWRKPVARQTSKCAVGSASAVASRGRMAVYRAEGPLAGSRSSRTAGWASR